MGIRVTVALLSRCEIDATLERLRRLERDLSSKEKELEERELRLRLWEERLMERSNVTPVSSLHVWPGFKDHDASFSICFTTLCDLNVRNSHVVWCQSPASLE